MNCTTNSSKKPLSTQNGTRLTQNYIAIAIQDAHLSKIGKLLPEPTHKDWLVGRDYIKHIFVYVIDGHITSYNQYRWVSNIKLGIEKFIFVPFDFIDDLRVGNGADIGNGVYTIKQLAQAFKAPLVIYPKIMYPPTKKELYRHLCWYGKRLIHQKVFTREALISAALLMNQKLNDKYSNKDLHKRAVQANDWLNENIDGFAVKLDAPALKQAHSKGAVSKNKQQAHKTKQLIDEAVATGNYTKPNGKINQSKLADDFGLNRSTIIRHLKAGSE